MPIGISKAPADLLGARGSGRRVFPALPPGRHSAYTRRVKEDREHGMQPLDTLVTARGVGNHDPVGASTE